MNRSYNLGDMIFFYINEESKYYNKLFRIGYITNYKMDDNKIWLYYIDCYNASYWVFKDGGIEFNRSYTPPITPMKFNTFGKYANLYGHIFFDNFEEEYNWAKARVKNSDFKH
jgi:hypothetical protein